MNYYAISALLNLVTNVFVGGIVFWKAPRSRQHQLFVLFCASVAFWSANYMAWQMTSSREFAIQMCRGLMLGVIWIPIFFFHYTVLLVGKKSYGLLVWFCYLAGVVFSFADFFSPLIVKAVVPRLDFKFWPVPGLLFHVQTIMFALLVGYAALLLTRAIRETSGAPQTQLKLSLIATIGGFGGGIANYFLWYNIPIRPVTTLSVSFYTVVVAYAMLKHQFLDIRLVVRDTTLNVFTAFLLSAGCLFIHIPLVSINPYLAVISAVLIMSVLMAFAYNPIRSALQPAIDRLVFANKFAYLEELGQLPNDVLEFTSMREMLNFLVTRLTQAARLEHAAVLMYDPAQQTYLNIIRYKNSPKGGEPQEVKMEWSLPQNAALIQILKDTNRLCTKQEIAQSSTRGEQAAAELEGFEGAACFGVMRDREVAGIVILGRKLNSEPFNQRDIQILGALKLRIENFLLQALVTTEESLNMVKDSHDMKNDVNALRSRIPLRRIKMKTFERTMVSQLQALAEGFAKAQLTPDQLRLHVEALKAEVTTLSQDQQSFLPIEEDSLDRLRNKLQNWSEFGRLVSQNFKGTQHKEPVDVTATAKIAIERWAPAAMRKRIDLAAKIGENLVVHGERSLVEQVLDNLIDNAIKATDNGSVTVTCGRQDGKVIMDIVDTGCGFSEEALKTILTKPFFQGEGRQGLEKSTGIGLVLVNTYVKNLGGEIHIESKQGAGATFHVILPAIEASNVAA